jgi:hypothetical protein
MIRLLLNKKLGREKTILLAWGQKSGGRNHNNYREACLMLEAMIQELNELGFTEDNNWGLADKSNP